MGKPVADEEREQQRRDVLSLYEGGASLRRISRLLDIPYSRVWCWVDPEHAARQRAWVKDYKARKRHEKVEAAKRAGTDEHPLADTSRATGRPTSARTGRSQNDELRRERVELARELYADGRTLRQVGDLLGVHDSTVSRWLRPPGDPHQSATAASQTVGRQPGGPTYSSRQQPEAEKEAPLVA